MTVACFAACRAFRCLLFTALLPTLCVALALAWALTWAPAARATASWSVVTPDLCYSDLVDVGWMDATHLWGVTRTSVYVLSDDGGATWTQHSVPDYNLHAGCFADASHGWFVGGGGVVYGTADGGATWTQQLTASQTSAECDLATIGERTWLMDSNGDIYTTTDGNWTLLATAPGNVGGGAGIVFGNALAFADAENGWAVGADVDYKGVIARTTDGGKTWSRQTEGVGSAYLTDVAFSDSQHGYAVGGQTVLRTVDGGAHWRSLNLGLSGDAAATFSANKISLVGPTSIWVSGTFLVLHSGDGGKTWRAQPIPDGRVVVALAFRDLAHGVVVGHSGLAALTSDGGELDVLPPVTLAVGANAWQTSPAQITLDAADEVSGVAGTEYKFDGASTWTNGTTFSVADEGVHSLVYSSTDKMGNREADTTVEVKVDGTAPTTSCSPAPATFLDAPYAPVFEALDQVGLSGVARTEWRLNGGVWHNTASEPTVAGDGTYDFSYRSVDVAGNQEAEHTFPLKVDVTAPVTTSTIDEAWHNAAVPVNLSAQDHGSGVDHVCYAVNGAATFSQGTSFTVAPTGADGGGALDVAYYAVDKVGHAESVKHETVRIDILAPATTITKGGKYQLGYWNNKASNLTYSAVDRGQAGVARTEIQVDGQGWQKWAAGSTFTIPAPTDHSNDGIHPILVKSTDNAGNAETALQNVTKIDTRLPVAQAPHSASVASGGTARLQFKISDRAPCCSVGGVAIGVYSRTGKLKKTIVPRKGFAKNVIRSVSFHCGLPRGMYFFVVWVADGAGNGSKQGAVNRLYVR